MWRTSGFGLPKKGELASCHLNETDQASSKQKPLKCAGFREAEARDRANSVSDVFFAIHGQRDLRFNSTKTVRNGLKVCED